MGQGCGSCCSASLPASSRFAPTRVMVSLLFGISAIDPLTFIAISLVLLIVAMLASYIRRSAPCVSMRWWRYVTSRAVAPAGDRQTRRRSRAHDFREENTEPRKATGRFGPEGLGKYRGCIARCRKQGRLQDSLDNYECGSLRIDSARLNALRTKSHRDACPIPQGLTFTACPYLSHKTRRSNKMRMKRARDRSFHFQQRPRSMAFGS